MSLAFNGTSYLARNGAPGFSTHPLSIACWIKPGAAGTNNQSILVGFGGSDSFGVVGDDVYGMRVGGWRAGGAFWPSTLALQPGVWNLVLVVYAADNRRSIYYRSGTPRVYTDSFPFRWGALTSMTVGAAPGLTSGRYRGELAHVAFWNAALGDADYAALAAGANPSTVQSSSLLDYWPLLTQDATQTGLNGRVLTATNTSAGTSDPPVTSTDTTPPTLTGTITVSNNITGTSYTLSWQAGSDDIAVVAYEHSVDGGTTWANDGNVLSVAVSGRTPGTTDTVVVRARDAGGNTSSPPLSTMVALPDTLAPVLQGPVSVSALTSTGYTLSWPAGSDNVSITAYEVSLDAGTSYTSVGNVLAALITGRTPGATDQVRVRARDGAGNVSTPPLGTSVTLPAPGDTTPPVLAGSITVSGLTSTGYALAWPAGSDNVAVTGYEVSLNAGTTWVPVGSATSYAVTGRTPGATDQVRVRARDAAGNVSTPSLSASVTLPAPGSAMLITPPLRNNTGTLLANLTNVKVNVYDVASGVLVLQQGGLMSSAAGVVTISDARLSAGTTYAYEVVTTSSGRRLPTGTAS